MKDKDLLTLMDTLGRWSLLWQAEMRAVVEEEGVTATEKRLLYGLMRAGKISKKELALRVVLEHSSVTRALDRLCDRGLVERVTSSADKRFVELVLTTKGKQKASAIKMRALKHFKRVTKDLSPRVVESATEMLLTMIENKTSE